MGRLTSLRTGVAVLDQRTAPLMPKEAEPFYLSPEWRALVRRLVRERGSRCEACEKARRVVGDHVKELRDGGDPLDERNVKLLCWPCHTSKSNRARAARQAAPLVKG